MVNLTKHTGRHASANELRSTDPAAQNYAPRHGRRYAPFDRKIFGGRVFIIHTTI